MEPRDVHRVERCRVCDGTSFEPALDLGPQPAANALLAVDAPDGVEPRYPLAICRCTTCDLVQLTHLVAPKVLFAHDYAYATSVSAGMAAHFSDMARSLTDRFVGAEATDALVVEIGSNDGTLLASLLGNPVVSVLGIDPSANACEAARAQGVTSICDFFTEQTATDVLARSGHAALVIANNVVAHVDDLGSMLRAASKLLTQDGVFAMEAPWIVAMLAGCAFDTIYHEHVSYLGLRPLQRAFERADLEVFDVEHQTVHGGSLRILAGRPGQRQVSSGLDAVLAAEDAAVTTAGLSGFARDAASVRDTLRAEIARAASRGPVVGYTAPAKATVMLNYAGIGPETLPYLADATPFKNGRLVPGVRIPIVTPERFRVDAPKSAVLFAWNHLDEVCRREASWRVSGGRFFVPLPKARWV